MANSTIYDPNKPFIETYDPSQSYVPLPDANLGVYVPGYLVIDGYEFPMHKVDSGSQTTTTTVDAGRNTKNEVIGRKISRDSSKLELEWAVLSATEWQNILNVFNTGTIEHTVEYYDQMLGRITRKMYVGDRTATPASIGYHTDHSMRVLIWKDAKINLIDCNRD